MIWLAATAGLRPLSLPDEGRYVGVAWEMLRSGHWLTPTLDGLPYFHKPPLFYWITAGSIWLFGPSEWAVRLAPWLGGCLGAAALLRFTSRWIGTGAARLAIAALLAQPLFVVGAQFANLDMLVAGFISATVLLLADAVLCLEAGLPHRRCVLWAGLCAALGVLSKGLIGVVIPALVLGLTLAASRGLRLLPRLLTLPALGLFAAVTLPWFVAMAWSHPGFLEYFFIEQQFRRYAAGGFNNVQPVWFYAAVLLVFALPWWPWIVHALRAGGDTALPDTRRWVRLLMVVWASTTVVFFSLPASKLIGYVLPALPPLAFLCAEGLQGRWGSAPRAQRWWWIGNALLLALGLAAVAVMTLRPLRSAQPLGRVLAEAHQADEPVWMLQHYAFDLPFYARLRQPVLVADDWSEPEATRVDSWRKELADAAAMADANAAAVLVPLERFEARLCEAPVSWVVAELGAPQRHPVLRQARLMAASGQLGLWRVQRTAALTSEPACQGHSRFLEEGGPRSLAQELEGVA